ncbi:Oligopeptide transport ATP-binding protein OppD [Microbacterium lemovicicum]|uniref:Oligopeptide transport ATP-binding protein OppD n=1 Tax=Microbacterium lemovicicum TaxID=1072463 RepID=A0A3S9W608_9MICO|nr:ABC transporter ATP-binding protein [Microbacterium lemovicicum]AZS35465.1 Oligopeptide transport ATP-binding protein OppD [Microbacterium lemovicicum]
MSLLEISGLTVRAAGTVLVDDVSLAVGPGDRVGLIGESGSGKSLTSLAAVGLLPDALRVSGSVLLDGHEVVGAGDRTLRPLRGPVAQVVFQEPLTALDPLMRVGAQIAEPLRRHLGLRGAALRDAVREALAEVVLTDPRIARAYPHELSGGQRQRVAIAMALAARPRLLIADEPTTALDVTVQDAVLSLLERLVAERGMALLFVSHDLAVVSRMTERIAVLRGGRVVESGPVGDVLWAPQHPYTAALVASARALDDALDPDASGAVPDADAAGPAAADAVPGADASDAVPGEGAVPGSDAAGRGSDGGAA